MNPKVIVSTARRFKTTSDTSVLLNALIESVNNSGATYCSHTEFHFTPSGYSVAIILAESHATLHYFPEDSCSDVSIGITNPDKVDIDKFYESFEMLAR